MLHKKLRCS
jgi:hypothetical protein